jgi:nicotinamide-nucleotide amidase
MERLMPVAERVGALLKQRGDKVAVAESSAGGLISAALLAVPGASAYYQGGVVVYTRLSRNLLLDLSDRDLASVPPNSVQMAALMAGAVKEKFGTTWALAETGAAGPGGNRYGHPSGRACFAVAGAMPLSLQIDTGLDDRAENMWVFAERALLMFEEALKG